MSVGKVGPANAGYYQSEIVEGPEDYYAHDGEAPGRWIGRADLVGAVAGGLVTAIDAGLLLEAKAAPDGTRLGRTTVTERSVTAFDLTFSAPKSVSVLTHSAIRAWSMPSSMPTPKPSSKQSHRCRLGSHTPARVMPALRSWMPTACSGSGIGIGRAGRSTRNFTTMC